MSKRKILIVVNYFYPYVSGVSEYARAIAVNLAKYHEVTVLTGKHIPELEDKEFIDGYTLIRAKPLLFLDKGYISLDFVRTFRYLSQQNDVINLHLPMLESGLFSMLTSKPLLVTYQCDMAVVGGLLSRLAVRAVRQSMRLALARAQEVVVLSKDYAKSSPIVHPFQSKIHEIAPPNRFEARGIHAAKEPKNNGLICGFVGRFVLEKGIESIIGAAKILKNESVEFWLAGDYKNVAGGSIFGRINDEIKSLGGKVRLLGSLSDDELVEFYQTIDILLLPSTNRFEAFGMVQMEAMTFGATVVTSDMPGVRETVFKTGIGQLCEPGSAQSLADAILRAKIERQNICRMEVRETVLNAFGADRFRDEYMTLIDRLCA